VELIEEKIMIRKHKHYDVIVAFAEGKVIQERDWEGNWADVSLPRFHPNGDYRIKPEKKPDEIRAYRVYCHYGTLYADSVTLTPNLTLTFDGDTGALKSAEVVNG
jgi:hypothetical protein